ncbi:MAG: carboxymuconolactone decarboxylase family protein [Bythopirellula sp.]
MPRIQPVNRTTASAETQTLLNGVEKKLGKVPNLIATLAQSNALAKGYMSFSQALSSGLIPPQLREQIALAIGQANQCDYCLAAHSAIGSSVGLSEDQIRDARSGASPDRRTEAALRFARQIVEKRGFVSDADISDIRNADFGEAEITEIIGHVALNMFTNYFNHIAETEVDFPAAAEVVSS